MSRMIENRPWGTFEVLLETEYTKVKEIVVLPKQRLSLQYHNHRSEVWTIVRGDGVVSLPGPFDRSPSEIPVHVGKVIQIAQGDFHRITAGTNGVTFIEAQLSPSGIFDEEDIIRLEDDYNRSVVDVIRKNQGHPHE